MSPQEIAAALGLKLTEEPDLDKLMKYDSQNTYACDKNDKVIGLNVCGNGLADEKVALIWKLFSLQALNLSENKLSSATIPKGMKALRRLNLSENASLQALSFEEGLSALEEANLSECGLTAIVFPAGFELLNTLELQKNKLGQVTFSAACPALERLDLSGNQLASFTLPAGFQCLHSLYLNNNQLNTLAFNGNLPALNTLHLQENQLSTIDVPEGLPALETLNLQNNKVNGLQFLARSQALQNLNLVKNAVTDLSPVRGLIEQGVPVQWKDSNGIAVEDNPLTTPPPEVVKDGNEAVLNYFREIDAQGTDTLYEAKLLLVGEGEAGKTSLCRRLFFPELPLPKPNETTKGIDIHRYEFSIENGKNFRINVWDFGGQEIYHATHQFFLTKRSLYILLDDTRKDHKSVHDEAFKYWLEVIELLGGDSPVLIFQNEKGGRSKSIDFSGIKGRFDNVKEKYNGDLNRADSVELIKDAIAFYVKHLPHIGESLPKKWIDIRMEIESLAREVAYISQKRYFDIYKKHLEFDRAKALHLSRYLHDLGVFLHFQDDELLSRIVILQNTWATEAVFKILDDEIVKGKGKMGRFTVDDCRRVWADSVYADMHPELRALMMKFELCYRLPDTKPDTWLAPQLLQPSKPKDLNGWEKPGDLILQYQYDFLPKGLVNRLMVRRHRFVQRPGLGWKNGVLFEKTGTQLLAQISEKGNEISLRSRGSERKELLSVISAELEALNDTFSGLSEKVKKMIPCNCSLCLENTNPEFYDYRRLVKRKEDNKLTLECPASYEEVSVLEMLDGIEADMSEIGAFVRTHKGNVTAYDYSFDSDIKGLEAALQKLVEKKNFLAKDLVSAYDSEKKFGLREHIKELENDIDEHRQKIGSLANRMKGYAATHLSVGPGDSSSIDALLRQTEQLREEMATLSSKMDDGFGKVIAHLSAQDIKLIDILSVSQSHQEGLKEIFQLVNENNFSEADMDKMAQQITGAIERNLQALPDDLARSWKQLQEEQAETADVKGSFKLRIPIIPAILEYEKEVSLDLRLLARKIWEDLKAGKVFLD